MNIYYILVGLVIFLLCAGIATAADTPYAITLTSSKDWVIANNSDTAIITAHVTNQSGSNVAGVQVEFRALDATLGSVVPGTSTTGSDGKAGTIFTTQFFNGNAHIFAFLASNPTINYTLIQKIDHGPPKYMTVGYQDQVQVGTNTTIFIRLFDKNWNPVDTLRDTSTGPSEIPQVRFVLDSSPGTNATFNGNWNSQVYSGTTIYSSVSSGLYVNETGIIAVDLRVSNQAGDNVITIDPLTAEPAARVIVIKGSSSSATPTVMDITVNPSRLYQPVDGVSKFSITYTLFDDAGNLLNGKNVYVTAERIDPGTGSVLENFGQSTVTTTSTGSGVYLFPAKNSPMYVRVRASCQENVNLTGSSLIEYYEVGPAYIGLTAMPDIMPSKDVATSINSSIMAKVTDQKSIPVPNVMVDFTITEIDYPSVQTTGPYLGSVENTTALSIITDQNGRAETIFNPGTFNVTGHQLFSANCSLTAKVSANPGISESHTLTWKNFPFISVTTSVSNSTNLSVNDTIDITIKIQGEGMEIAYREPMDVVLATSRARSMLEENPDRMILAFIAEHRFIDKITQTTPYTGSDQIGLLTYGGNPNGIPNLIDTGWSKGDPGIDTDEADDPKYITDNYPGRTVMTYYSQSTWEVPPTSNYVALRNAINKTVPFGGTSNQNEMPFRKAMYDAISQLRNTTNPNKAIIALVDSDITDYGDVLARGSANKKDPGKFNGGTQSFYPFPGPDPAHPWADNDPSQNMATYANQNGVKVYVIYAAKQLNSHDETTLKTLAESTGGAYNYTGSNPGSLSSVYEWIADTLIRESAINATMTINMGTIRVNQVDIIQNVTPVFDYVHEDGKSTRIQLLEDQDGVTQILADQTIDQTDDYKDKILTFVVGTVKLHQTWQADYRLKVLVEADAIDIFGNGSVISFENLGSDISYQLQTISISVPTDKTTKQETYDLTIDEFNVANESDGVPISWTLSYTKPDANPNEVHARIVYLDSSGNMHTFGGVRPGLTGSVYIPKSLLPPDGYALKFMIVADAPLAPQRQKIQEFPGTAFIPTGLGGIGPGGLGGGTGENSNGGILILK